MSSIFKLAPVKHTTTTLKPAKETSTLSVREDNILEDPAADFTRTPSPTPHPRGTLSSLSLKRKRNLYGKRSVRSTESAHSEATTATSGRSKDSVSFFIYFITYLDKISADKSAENFARCRKFCPPNYFVG